MDFKDYLNEEEKKVEKLAVCFIKDVHVKEVYTVLSSKSSAEAVIKDHPNRYGFLAPSEGVKLVSKGWNPKLFDLSGLTKHVKRETEEDLKKAPPAPEKKEDKKE